MTERTMTVCVSEEFLSFLEREAASWGYEDAQAHLQGLVDWAISHTMLITNEPIVDGLEEATGEIGDLDAYFDDGIPF
jgi:hypothetical protein